MSNNKNKEIDIIIPAYNAFDTLDKTLMSICMQSIVNKVNCIIVDDCSTDKDRDNKYEDLINYFSKYFSIKLIVNKENVGPGWCRHIGLDNSTAKYVSFIDADDVFATSTALFNMYNELENDEHTYIVSCTFQEELRNEKGEFVGYLDHDNDLTWMFGKMYRSSFLKQHNINFNNSRANEDSGFNGLCLMCLPEFNIKYSNRLSYCWNYNENSITKTNDYEYNGLNGYIHNHIWAIHNALENNGNIKTIISHSVNTITLIYIYYQNIIKEGRSQEQINQYLDWAVDFYRDVYIIIREQISPQTFTECHLNTMELHKNIINGFIPTISIFEFMNMLNDRMLQQLNIREAIDENGNRLGYVPTNIENPTNADIINAKDFNEFLKTGKVKYEY